MSTHSSFYSYELCLLTVNTLANATDLLHQQQYYLIVLKQAGAPARGKLQWLISQAWRHSCCSLLSQYNYCFMQLVD